MLEKPTSKSQGSILSSKTEPGGTGSGRLVKGSGTERTSQPRLGSLCSAEGEGRARTGLTEAQRFRAKDSACVLIGINWLGIANGISIL